jgi:hypothetical protein
MILCFVWLLNHNNYDNEEEEIELVEDVAAGAAEVANVLARGRAARMQIVEELELARAQRHLDQQLA